MSERRHGILLRKTAGGYEAKALKYTQFGLTPGAALRWLADVLETKAARASSALAAEQRRELADKALKWAEEIDP